jgi:hypothetical protein
MPAGWMVLDPASASAKKLRDDMERANPQMARQFQAEASNAVLQVVSTVQASAKLPVKDCVTVKRYASGGRTQLSDRDLAELKQDYSKNLHLKRGADIARVELEAGSAVRCAYQPTFKSPFGPIVAVPTIDYIVTHGSDIYTFTFTTSLEGATAMARIADEAMKTLKLR